MKIKLNTIKDVQDFVKLANTQCYSEVIAKQDNYIVNAKSIMGLFSLDLIRPFTIECDEIDSLIFKEFETDED